MTNVTPWDPEMESPATLAILDGNPTGIEAALYGRFLGYNVLIFDAGRPAKAFSRWANRTLTGTATAWTTNMGRRAIETHDEQPLAFPLDAKWTGGQAAELYYTPLAKTDLLHDEVLFNTQVVEIMRQRVSPADRIDAQQRANDQFYLQLDSRNRGRYWEVVDAILDCRPSQNLGLGPGGGRAIGEADVEFWTYWPLDDRFEPNRVAGRDFLLVGTGGEAERFVREWRSVDWGPHQPARVKWLVRPGDESWAGELIGDGEDISVLAGWGVAEVRRDGDAWQCDIFTGDDSLSTLRVGHIVEVRPGGETNRAVDITPSLLVGQLDRQLDALREQPGWRWATAEPNYYRLPPTSPQTSGGVSDGCRAIVEVFALLGGRPDLNLYEIMERSPT